LLLTLAYKCRRTKKKKKNIILVLITWSTRNHMMGIGCGLLWYSYRVMAYLWILKIYNYNTAINTYLIKSIYPIMFNIAYETHSDTLNLTVGLFSIFIWEKRRNEWIDFDGVFTVNSYYIIAGTLNYIWLDIIVYTCMYFIYDQNFLINCGACV